jgi:hypothetical protein
MEQRAGHASEPQAARNRDMAELVEHDLSLLKLEYRVLYPKYVIHQGQIAILGDSRSTRSENSWKAKGR